MSTSTKDTRQKDYPCNNESIAHTALRHGSHLPSSSFVLILSLSSVRWPHVSLLPRPAAPVAARSAPLQWQRSPPATGHRALRPAASPGCRVGGSALILTQLRPARLQLRATPPRPPRAPPRPDFRAGGSAPRSPPTVARPDPGCRVGGSAPRACPELPRRPPRAPPRPGCHAGGGAPQPASAIASATRSLRRPVGRASGCEPLSAVVAPATAALALLRRRPRRSSSSPAPVASPTAAPLLFLTNVGGFTYGRAAPLLHQHRWSATPLRRSGCGLRGENGRREKTRWDPHSMKRCAIASRHI